MELSLSCRHDTASPDMSNGMERGCGPSRPKPSESLHSSRFMDKRTVHMTTLSSLSGRQLERCMQSAKQSFSSKYKTGGRRRCRGRSLQVTDAASTHSGVMPGKYMSGGTIPGSDQGLSLQFPISSVAVGLPCISFLSLHQEAGWPVRVTGTSHHKRRQQLQPQGIGLHCTFQVCAPCTCLTCRDAPCMAFAS